MGGQEEAPWSAMVSSAKSEGAGLVEKDGRTTALGQRGTGGVFFGFG